MWLLYFAFQNVNFRLTVSLMNDFSWKILFAEMSAMWVVGLFFEGKFVHFPWVALHQTCDAFRPKPLPLQYRAGTLNFSK
jgi:hypothetical protein